MIFFLAKGLGPEIITFLKLIAILAPLNIIGIIILLKKIEKKDPNRIRWK